MNKNALLLFVFIFGFQSIKPNSWYHDSWHKASEFIGKQGKSCAITGTALLFGGAAIHAVYKAIKPKALEKLEQYNKNYDQHLIKEIQQYTEYLHSKYEKEFMIIDQSSTERVAQELSKFFETHNINYITYVRDLVKDMQTLNNKNIKVENRLGKHLNEHSFSEELIQLFLAHLKKADELFDVLKNIHDSIIALPRYYEELKNDQELTLQAEREYQEQLDTWRHEHDEQQNAYKMNVPVIDETLPKEESDFEFVQSKESILDDSERFLETLDLY